MRPLMVRSADTHPPLARLTFLEGARSTLRFMQWNICRKGMWRLRSLCARLEPGMQIENPSDDPREFRAVGGSPWEDAPLGEMDPFSGMPLSLLLSSISTHFAAAGLFALLSRNPPMRPSPQAESRRSSTDQARSPSDPGTRSQVIYPPTYN